MSNSLHKIMSSFWEYTQLLVATILASIGLKAFLLPNGFLDGGVTGIAILISSIFGLNISLILIIISIPFLLLAWKTVSKRIVIKSIIAIIIFSLFIHLENFSPITEDKLLISIFGGLFLGAGLGLALKNGAVLDGSEVLGIYINNRFGFSIGKVSLFFNILLFVITAIAMSIEIVMYSILTYLVTSKVIDLMIEGFEDYVGLMIISSNPKMIEEKIIDKVGTGITVYKGSRGYGSTGSKEEMDILHLVINRIDIGKTYHLIDQIDKKAFVIEFDINNIKGGISRKVFSKKELGKLAPKALSGAFLNKEKIVAFS